MALREIFYADIPSEYLSFLVIVEVELKFSYLFACFLCNTCILDTDF